MSTLDAGRVLLARCSAEIYSERERFVRMMSEAERELAEWENEGGSVR